MCSVSGPERDYHWDMIEAFIECLLQAMHEKDDLNAHKKPLSEESDSELVRGADREHGEVDREEYRCRRFETDWWPLMLEVADYCLYRAEQTRRATIHGNLRDSLREKAYGEETTPEEELHHDLRRER